MSDFPRLGFTLVELVVVVLIIGILAAVAAPRLLDTSTAAHAAAELRNAQVVLDAVSRYMAIHGEYPGDAGPGGFPSDFTDHLRGNIFGKPSPSGGQYDWDGPPPHAGSERLKLVYPAGTTASALPIYPLLEDADDGSPTTGWITASGRRIEFWP